MRDFIGEFPQNYHRFVLVGGFNPSEKLKYISQIGNLPQIGVKIRNIWNHHLAIDMQCLIPKKNGNKWWPLNMLKECHGFKFVVGKVSWDFAGSPEEVPIKRAATSQRNLQSFKIRVHGEILPLGQTKTWRVSKQTGIVSNKVKIPLDDFGGKTEGENKKKVKNMPKKTFPKKLGNCKHLPAKSKK